MSFAYFSSMHEPPAENGYARSIPNALLYCAGAMLLIFAARACLLLVYSGSIPFWDQWGGENSLFAPYLSGDLTLSQLVAPHNEHRIFWTRLLTVALFDLNGNQWDNAVEAFASNAVYGFALLIPIYVAARHLPTRSALLCTLTVVLGAALPYAWENTLIGFQSQFYISILLAMLMIQLASSAKATLGAASLLLALALASLLSMASGVFAIVAAAAVLLFRTMIERSLSRTFALPLSLACAAIVAIGLALTPSPPAHSALKAQNLLELWNALSIALSWPLPAPVFFLTWLPTLIWFIGAVLGRPISTADRFFFGIALFGAAQAFAVAYSRGHGMTEITSRYADGIFLTLLSNVYFATRNIASQQPFVTKLFAGYLPPLALLLGILFESNYQTSLLQQRAYYTRHETINVARYLGGDRSALFGKPHSHIPFPDEHLLAAGLEDKLQRAYLPTSLSGYGESAASPTSRGCIAFGGTSTNSNPTGVAISCSRSLPIGGLSIASPTGPLSARVMQARRLVPWSGFATPRPSSDLSIDKSVCHIDVVNDVAAEGSHRQVYSDAILRLAGWAKPSPHGITNYRAQPLSVALRNGNQIYKASVGRRRLPRPDVAAALKDEAYQWSGFDVFIDISHLPLGRYRLLTTTGDSPFCDTGYDIVTSPSGVPFSRF